MALNTYLGMALLVFASGAIAVAGLLVMRKLVHYEKFKPSHDVGGFLLSVVAVLYAVLLGMIVVDALQQYNRAREITEAETNNLTDVSILAKGLPKERSDNIRQMCSDYAKQVVDTEWQLMSEGTYCPIARGKAVDLMESLMDFEPRTEKEKTIFPEIVHEASLFWQNRQARLGIAEKGIPIVEWVVLVTGAAMTVIFTYFFGVENAKLQVVMTAMVAVLIALNLGLLLLFASPFSGDLAVHVDAFNDLQSILGTPPAPAK
jgi:hypothetical protein